MKNKFYLPGFIENINLFFALKKIETDFPYVLRDNCSIGAAYGNAFGCAWEGGRPSFNSLTKQQLEDIRDKYKDKNIPIRLTMTNLLIEEKHLGDLYSNMILSVFHDDFNEVLVANDILEKYIRTYYPKYKIVRSTLATEKIPYDDTDKYYMSVLDRRKNKDYDFLKSIQNKNKIELILNELCFPNCPYIYSHYKYQSACALEYMQCDFPPNSFCAIKNKDKMENIERVAFPFGYRATHRDTETNWYTGKELYEEIIPMGFNNFKIVGRNYGTQYVVESINEYMIKPEYWHDFSILVSTLN